ncbi:MAG: GNAT family N-acetyltransferase [Chlorobiaceae bacterium]|nr:GNAT family N-acetyltransferase [Chlorobiaceae bacterium]NTW11661.1 GNAT family N-acetyltransferase [Chlorobiaceae bacterium]
MKTERDFTIRTMTRKEVEIAIEWAAKEGWNPGVHDAECFYRADPDGFLVGLLGKDPVAVVSAVKYGKSFGFIGLYIVQPEDRGMGSGFRLGRAALKRLEGRTIGLDGVLEREENYREIGFSFAYCNMRFEGISGGLQSHRSRIKSLAEIPFEQLLTYDRHFFPDDRKAFLECWVRQEGAVAFGVMENDRLAGYGLIRRCRKGFKIGPLFADSPELAEELFSALKASVPAEMPFYLDIPESNPDALQLVKRHGMKVVFSTARMYKGRAPELPLERMYGITTFELG